MTSVTEDPVVRLNQAAVILGIKRRTLYDWIADGLLPRPLELGPRARGYRESVLRQFLESRKGAQQ